MPPISVISEESPDPRHLVLRLMQDLKRNCPGEGFRAHSVFRCDTRVAVFKTHHCAQTLPVKIRPLLPGGQPVKGDPKSSTLNPGWTDLFSFLRITPDYYITELKNVAALTNIILFDY